MCRPISTYNKLYVKGAKKNVKSLSMNIPRVGGGPDGQRSNLLFSTLNVFVCL